MHRNFGLTRLLLCARKIGKIEIGGQKEDKNQKRNPATLDFQWVAGFYSAQNRTNILTFYYIEIPFILH